MNKNNFIGIKDIEQECLICKKLCKNRKAIAMHLSKTHKMRVVDYVIKYINNNQIPLCKCGCGREVKWNKCNIKFNNYINGHNEVGFKVKQPIFTKEQIEKRNLKIKKRYEKDKVEICKKISKKVKEALLNQDIRKKRNIALSNSWTTERRKENSLRAVHMLESNLIGPTCKFNKIIIFNPFTKQEEFMHSSWETKFFNLCIKNNIFVTKKHNLKINYIFKNLQRIYIPDFILKEKKLIVEIKGMIDDQVNAKFLALQEWCKVNDFSCLMLTSLKEINDFFITENNNAG